MEPENRALLVAVLAVVAVAVAGGGYFLLAPPAASTLVVPFGTVLQVPSSDAVLDFNVTPPGGTLVGAWSSTGNTCAMLLPLGTGIPRAVLDGIIENCIAQGGLSGTFNTDLTGSAPGGVYSLVFLSDTPVTVRITQDIQVVY